MATDPADRCTTHHNACSCREAMYVRELGALLDGIRKWADAKYPDHHGGAVTMPESDARLIALLGEGNDG